MAGREPFRLLLASTREGASRTSRTGVAASWRSGIISSPTRFYLVPRLEPRRGFCGDYAMTVILVAHYLPTRGGGTRRCEGATRVTSRTWG